MYAAPTRCPVCRSELTVTRLHCPACDTSIEGQFTGGPFAHLTAEHLDFIVTFVRCEGKINRMEQELRRDPASAPASYWLAAAARAAGDLDRAWAAASAGWIRAALGRDKGVALRADLEKLVTQGIIPDRVAKVPARDRSRATTTMTTEWENFKKIW